MNCFPRLRPALFPHAARTFVRVVAVAIVGCALAACRTSEPREADEQAQPDQSEFNPAHYGAIVGQPPRPPHKWTKFVSVRGQPEPVPIEWVATPEGKFAHDIVIPNPVPKDSGYKRSMSATEYFAHLCESEAGEFVFKTVKDVPGFLFMRVPGDIGNYEMKDRYLLEAPVLQRRYAGRLDAAHRGRSFAGGSARNFSYYEEPLQMQPIGGKTSYVMVFDSDPRTAVPRRQRIHPQPASSHGLTWRGLIREEDRRLGIAGFELLVIDLKSFEVLGALRNYLLSGFTPGTADGIYWLNAASCNRMADRDGRFDHAQIYDFVAKVIRPSALFPSGSEP